jgi:predicted amidophosphoribosyltransferase
MKDTPNFPDNFTSNNQVWTEFEEPRVLGLPTERIRKLVAQCQDAVSAFRRASIGVVPSPELAWEQLLAAFRELAQASTEAGSGIGSKPVLATRLGGAGVSWISCQLIERVSENNLQVIKFVGDSGVNLTDVSWQTAQAAVPGEIWYIKPVAEGWEVIVISDRSVKYQVTANGLSQEMSAEALKSREGLTDREYIERVNPGTFTNSFPLPEKLEEEKAVFYRIDIQQFAAALQANMQAMAKNLERFSPYKQAPVMTTVEMREMRTPGKKIELEHETDPRFISVTKEFLKLQSDFYASAINQKRFEEEIERLKIRDDNGDWWAIDPDKNQWMRFDGRNWVSEKPPKVKAIVIEKIIKPPEKDRPEEKSLETVKVTPEPTAEIKPVVQPPPTTIQPSPAPSQLSCPVCGAPLKEGALFCGSCGKRMDMEKELILDLKQPLCPHCNAPIKPEARFCGSCGTTLSPLPQAVQRPTPEPPRPNLCPNCKGQIKAGAKFCTSCGQAIPSKDRGTPAKPPSVQPTSLCPHCGGQIKIGVKFCTHCGGSLSGQSSAKLSHSLPQTDISSGIVEDKRTLLGAPSVMNTTLSYLPGVAIDFLQHWPSYSKDPMSAVNIVLPSLLSIFSVGISPKIGKWISLILVVVAFGWLLIPFFTGGNVVDNSGRGIVGISFFYTIARLLRATQR